MARSQMVYSSLKSTDKPSKKQLEEINNAAKYPPNLEDMPEIPDEVLKQIAADAKAFREKNNKEVVSLRLTKKTISKAKTLGKGYTSVLSRILDNVLSNEELLKLCLK